ncbi:hypothetical protein MPSEU_000748100 [Mayamaea pseudoterrestris]|nr:hypothetical protein MPSEU_000748100 [Mayamaea pseudoterrestris]
MPRGSSEETSANEYHQLSVRPHDRLNLFARLSQRFVSNVARNFHAADDARQNEATVEFLALEVKKSNGESIYVSYNGGLIDDGAEMDSDLNANVSSLPCIELPRSIIASCDLASMVQVRVLPVAPPTASSLSIQALSMQDYLRLSQAAEWLEEGGLLKQVSIVYPNQLLSLRMDDVTVIQVRVLSNQEIASDGHGGTIWEEDQAVQEANEGHCSSLDQCAVTVSTKAQPLPFNCWRLAASTDLTVLPPAPQAGPLNGLQCRLYPSKLDYSCVASLPSSVPQGCALVNSRLYERLCEKAAFTCEEGARPFESLQQPSYIRITAVAVGTSSTATIADRKATRILRLEVMDQVSDGWIVLHPLCRQELDLTLANDFVRVELVTRSEVSSLCSTARFMGVQLQAVPVQRHRHLAAWRYPSACVASSSQITSSVDNNVIEEAVAVKLSWFNDIAFDFTPIKINSLISLPWNTENSRQALGSSIHYRVALHSDNQAAAVPLLEDDLYVFAHEMRRLLMKLVPATTESIDNLNSSVRASIVDPVILRESFSLSRSLQKQNFYGLLLLDKLTPHMRSFMLCGGTGSGKTQSALFVAAQVGLQRHLVYLDCRRLKESKAMRLSTILQELEALFVDAMQSEDSIIVLDNLDDVLSNHGNEGPETGSAHIMQPNPALKDECFAIESTLTRLLQDSGAVLVITCSESDAIPNSFRSNVAPSCVMNLPLLLDDERKDFYLDLLEVADISCRDKFARAFSDFARKSRGFRPGDLERLASRVKQRVGLADSCLASATRISLDRYTPLGKVSAVTNDFPTNNEWSDIGGLFDVKNELSSIVLRPSLYKRIYDKAQIRLPRGVLLFGPSGAGKSFIVPALAKKCGYPLIVCHGPELLSKYIGASEAKVRALFARAASVAPSILFLDELDSLAPRRGSDSTGVTDRVVNQLLTFLDGVEDSNSSSGTVYIIAATSRPDKIDPALLRPGRLERHIYVGISRTPDEWTDIVIKTAKRYIMSSAMVERISSGQLLKDVRDKAPFALQFTAADINAVFYTAEVTAAHETIALGRDTDQISLRWEHIIDAFRTTRPSMSMDGWQQLERVYESFRDNKKEFKEGQLSPESLKVALM